MIVDKYKLKGITSFTTYSSGEMKECKVNEYNEIHVKNNILIPRYRGLDERKKDTKALSFYEDGTVKSIAMDQQTEITTSLGNFSAELITFFESGEIESVFPVNGQIGFGWSLEEEEQLLEQYEFDLSVGTFETKVIGVRFYENRNIKCIILWPKENVTIYTPIGVYPVRIGLRLYPDGALQSFEPAIPISIKTAIGDIIAFDQHALGMDADYNSVNFYPNGELQSLNTNSDIVVNNSQTGQRTIIYQQLKLDMLTSDLVKMPVKISFTESMVTIDNGAESISFEMEHSKFLLLHDGGFMEKKCSPGSDCSDCGSACM